MTCVSRLLCALTLCAPVPVTPRAFAAPPGIPYGGSLTTPSGAQYEGTLDAEAAVYAQQAAGSAIWGPYVFTEINATNGAFAVVLDDATVPLAGALDGLPEAWLEFRIRPEGESAWIPLEGRQQLLSVPYAHYATSAEQLAGTPASEFLTATEVGTDFVRTDALAAVATSGDYADLMSKPDLSGYALTSGLAGVCFSGSYADLIDEPDVSAFVTSDALATVATTGSYSDLSGKPDLSVYALLSGLSPIATSGNYADLQSKPNLSVYAAKDSLAVVATTGAYSDLSGAPTTEALLDGILKADGTVALTGPWDLGGQPLSGVAIAPSDAPLAEVEGALWFDSNTSTLKVYDGTEWGQMGLTGAVATDLACSGCVDASDLNFVLATVATSGNFADLVDVPDGLGDGDDDELKELGPTCVAAGDVAKWNGTGWECAPDEGVRTAELETAIETGVADSLAASGPEAITGGLLTNKFSTTYSATDTPVTFTGYSPTFSESVIVVPDLGTATTFTVTVNIEHPDATALEVHLVPPADVGAEVVLHELGAGTGGGLAGTYPTELTPYTGSLDSFIEKNLAGTWTLKVRDNVGPPIDDDGSVASWSVGFDYVAHSKLAATGGLEVLPPINPGDAASKSYVDASHFVRLHKMGVELLQPGEHVSLVHNADTEYVSVDVWFRDPFAGLWMHNASAWKGDGFGDGSDGAFEPSSDVVLSGGTHQFTSFRIPSSVTVTVTGSTPLVILSQEAVNIDGILNLAGGDGQDISSEYGDSAGGSGGGGGGAAGASSTAFDAPNAGNGPGGGGQPPFPYNEAGGGGGGGGHAAVGGSGNPPTCGTSSVASGGSSYSSVEAGSMVGGSGGGSGFPGDGNGQNSGGGGGGGGGGAVKIVAPRILVAGVISADGGRGANVAHELNGGGGGGGSGGVVWLVAETINVEDGDITALGGAGGLNNQVDACRPGTGGAGAEGRIRLDTLNASGQTNPIPTTVLGAPTKWDGGSPLLVFQEDRNSVAFQNASSVPLSVRILVRVP